MSKILIIEDDLAIVRLLTVVLKTNNYETLIANTGFDGISMFLSYQPDLVLLDMGLPDVDGMEVLEQIRAVSKNPILIISARDREKEKVKALDNGADDYITKPFNVGELMARVRVAFRKSIVKDYKNNIFTFNKLEVDFDKHKVLKDGVEIHLTPIEFKLLKLLIDYQGKVLTHKYIQKSIWGYETDEDYQSLRVFMATLRRKLETDTNNPKYILTEVGVGYRFSDE